jgi:hypothetical protein
MSLKTTFIITNIMLYAFSLEALDDVHWAAITNIICENADKSTPEKLQADKESAIEAYRNISSEGDGFAHLTSTLIQKSFPETVLPKRYAELNAEEVKAETQQFIAQDAQEFIKAQGVQVIITDPIKK